MRLCVQRKHSPRENLRLSPPNTSDIRGRNDVSIYQRYLCQLIWNATVSGLIPQTLLETNDLLVDGFGQCWAKNCIMKASWSCWNSSFKFKFFLKTKGKEEEDNNGTHEELSEDDEWPIRPVELDGLLQRLSQNCSACHSPSVWVFEHVKSSASHPTQPHALNPWRLSLDKNWHLCVSTVTLQGGDENNHSIIGLDWTDLFCQIVLQLRDKQD